MSTSVNAESEVTTSKSSKTPKTAAILAICAVVVIALSVGVGILTYGYVQDSRAESARTEAVEAAKSQAVAMLAYDFNTVDTQLPSAADGLTGTFREDYMTLVNDTIIPGAKERQLVVQTSVQAAAVIETTPDTAAVLLYLNQITTSKDAPDATTSGSRVRIDLQKVDGQWLVDSLKPV